MRRRRTTATINEILVLSGVTELAVGALTGWPYALAVSDPEKVRKLGIRSVPRLRQWHLDLIALGGLTMLVGTAVPNLPRRVAWPLAVGAWTNANAFGLLAFNPDADHHRSYRAAVGTSFATVTWGSMSLAVLVARRIREN
jgi:fatty acid desaturase